MTCCRTMGNHQAH